MISQLVATRTEIERTELTGDTGAYHDCLVAGYMSYLKAAGYSKIPHEIRIFERGARRFLSKFSDPQDWLSLPAEVPHRCDGKERSFVHYLILRRLVPMSLTYMLTPRPRFYQMAIRLMERETFQLYQKAASRLGYQERSIKDQFRSLLCLMIWTQKPINSLTLDDLNRFIQELRTVYLSGKWRQRCVSNGLPARWDAQLKCVRNV
ncbi:MAG: hypothetical protein Q8O97_03170, partial [bacterium]|nr:hypothetical protein [bacterium]